MMVKRLTLLSEQSTDVCVHSDYLHPSSGPWTPSFSARIDWETWPLWSRSIGEYVCKQLSMSPCVLSFPLLSHQESWTWLGYDSKVFNFLIINSSGFLTMVFTHLATSSWVLLVHLNSYMGILFTTFDSDIIVMTMSFTSKMVAIAIPPFMVM